MKWISYCRNAAPALAGKREPVEDRTPVGMCFGYISGLADALQHLCATSHLKRKLPLEQRKGIVSVTTNPECQSYRLLISSFIKFVDENPDLLDVAPTPFLLQRPLQRDLPCAPPEEYFSVRTGQDPEVWSVQTFHEPMFRLLSSARDLGSLPCGGDFQESS